MTTPGMLQWLLFTLVVLQEVNAVTKMLRRGQFGMLGSPPITTPDQVLPPTQWFTQWLDHTDPTNNRTWQQRYYEINSSYTAGGPVFLMLWGEGAIDPGWLVSGSWVNYTEQYNALVFFLEHRFYGESHPTSNLTVENLKHLSSGQALEDAAYFVKSMNKVHKLPQGTKWIVFGGSYAGNLAAWMRDKYPALVHGAVSASGPVLAKVDFYEYFGVVRHSFRTYGKGCRKAIENANQRIIRLLKTPSGQATLYETFTLCGAKGQINATKVNVYNLLETLADNLAGVVQYNKDNRRVSPTWNITIDTVCDMMVNDTAGDSVKRLGAVNSMILNAYGLDCLPYTYDDMIQDLRETSWNSTAVRYGERQWTYQTCTEFGYYQTSEKKRQFFGNDFPLGFFLHQCSDIFGEAYSKAEILDAVQRTNIEYGGKEIKATRVVYVHGSVDPWHALGITKSTIPESPSIFIKGAAHCADMYPAAEWDPPALAAARKEVGDLIGQWLQQY